MIIHVFNSSIVSGPESLVIPALKELGASVVFLIETRLPGSEKALLDYARSQDVKAYTISVRSRFDLRAIWKLRTLLKQLGANLVHSHDVKASLYTAAACQGIPGIKRISTHHGIHGRPDRKSRLYERIYSRLVLKAFHATIAVSQGDYNELRRRLRAKLFLQLIQNGISQEALSESARNDARNQVRQAWGISNHALVLGAVGRLSAEKRGDRMIRILAKIQDLPWTFCFIGRGPEEAAWKALAKELGISDRIRWLGYRANAALELAGLDLLLLLSDAEGLPIVILEAALARTPVFATKVGGVSDIIPDSSYGHTVEKNLCDEEIAQLLRKAISEKAGAQTELLQNRVAKHFNRSEWIAKHKQLYGRFIVDSN